MTSNNGTQKIVRCGNRGIWAFATLCGLALFILGVVLLAVTLEDLLDEGQCQQDKICGLDNPLATSVEYLCDGVPEVDGSCTINCNACIVDFGGHCQRNQLLACCTPDSLVYCGDSIADLIIVAPVLMFFGGLIFLIFVCGAVPCLCWSMTMHRQEFTPGVETRSLPVSEGDSKFTNQNATAVQKGDDFTVFVQDKGIFDDCGSGRVNL